MSRTVSGSLASAGGSLLGTLDEARVYRDAHVGAIYLHQGDSYLVSSLDSASKQVSVSPAHVDYYTQTRQETDLEVVDDIATVQLGEARLHLGMVEVANQVVGYQRRKLGSRELIDTIDLDLPASLMTTASIWLTVPDDARPPRAGARSARGFHAAEHAGIRVLPLMAVCDRWDIGGLSTNWHHRPAPPRSSSMRPIRAAPGSRRSHSIGAGGIGWRRWKRSNAAPARGCPSCVQSPKCGNLNEPLSKSGAISLLRAILGDVAVLTARIRRRSRC